MITAGIDMGAKTVKVVLLQDGTVRGRGLSQAGFDAFETARMALEEALGKDGLRLDQVEHFTSTGAGRKEVSFAHDDITDVGATAKAINFLLPSARTVIDVGAEDARAIRSAEGGKVVDFVVNEKCAAGAGTFVETMARILEIPMEEMGPLSLESTKEVPINAQCTVFAESEVVSLIHANTPKADIARAVHEGMADRITSMARRVGVEKEVALVGGVAQNVGFIAVLESNLELEVVIPEAPEFVGALGAALAAAERS